MTTKRVPSFAQRLRDFRRVLELEARRGYDDRAVVGGLGRFLDRWRAELTEEEADSLPTSLTSALAQRRYRDLSPELRERWVHEALTALGDHLGAAEGEGAGGPSTGSGRTGGGGSGRTAARAVPARRLSTAPAAPSLESPATIVRGIGPGIADKLGNLGVTTVNGLLRHYPARHLAVSTVAELDGAGEKAIVGTVWSVGRRGFGRGQQMQATDAVVGDATGNVQVVWFNQAYVAGTIKNGDRILVSGYFRAYRGRPTLEAGNYEVLPDDAEPPPPGSLVPVYPATKGLTQRTLRRIIGNALDAWLPRLEESLPEDVRERQGLLPLAEALGTYHRPESDDAKAEARRRLAFDEMIVRQLFLLERKHNWQEAPAVHLPMHVEALRSYVDALPFKLTRAQRRVLREVLDDIAEVMPAHRLLEGDVGSGKTVVALGAMLNAAAHGYQAAMMAPTELLAEQHFQTISRLLEAHRRPIDAPNRLALYLDPLPRPVVVGLLLGSHTQRQKAALRREVRDGAVDIVVGTHALLQEATDIPNLALAVVDEEHRFGVAQRSALTGKGGLRPHLISMSATPIPRSLALTVYGDLDISTIDELPPGRTPNKTRWLRPDQRNQAVRFIRKEVREGHQAFVVCPIIDESEALQVSAAVEEHRRLSEEVFPELRVGLLHGRMTLAEKNSAMDKFRDGELDILVSTPVVEVGVDIPNATVMMVEAANRFGLSALHQLRGRVGRGEAQGYCILMADEVSDNARERLEALEQESDGFRVAEADLRLRGPGELAGTRQSGLPDLLLADLHDVGLVTATRDEANAILARDPKLELDEHRGLAEAVEKLAARIAAQG
ncbi:MAG: ATP-dependent DNA helicase RecG [Chloroflexota bacterium]|nr:ATP-dependent DNA helicase RecG [Chloroflexota bacterium]